MAEPAPIVEPMSDGSGRVHATSPSFGSSLEQEKHDFTCAYQVAVAPDDTRTSEDWARDIWEGAPLALRWFMTTGWRFVLRLRLGPARSPDYILGWRIVDRRTDLTVCRLGSGLLHAGNVFRLVDGSFVWSTYVSYERPLARVIWPPVAVIHRLTVRVSLRRAARNGT